MAVIHVPRPPAGAFDKNRPPSSLLRSQIAHLEWASRSKLGGKLSRRAQSIRTEGQAAAYIAELTRRLHPAAAEPTPQTGAVAQVKKKTKAPATPAPARKRRAAGRRSSRTGRKPARAAARRRGRGR